MQHELDFDNKWRVAVAALLVSALTGGVVFRLVTSRGPSWVFYAISAGVLTLVAIDVWEHLHAARVRIQAMRVMNGLDNCDPTPA
jgi:high-affinity Fe2+/Pb2+ permease